MTVLVVVPARWGSARLPGKPLAVLAGRTLLDRVIAVARAGVEQVEGADLLIATDDKRVGREAERLGCDWVMTGADLASGSDRVLAAVIARGSDTAHVVNLQGDAVFMPIAALTAVLKALIAHAPPRVVTPVVRLTWGQLDALRHHKQRSPFSGTTCVRAADNTARWFSKTVLPAIRDEQRLRSETSLSPVWQHIGLYGYELEALRRFAAAPASIYEELEGLEQLRLIELGVPIHTIAVAAAPLMMSGIDTAADLALAEAMIAERGDPYPQ